MRLKIILSCDVHDEQSLALRSRTDLNFKRIQQCTSLRHKTTVVGLKLVDGPDRLRFFFSRVNLVNLKIFKPQIFPD